MQLPARVRRLAEPVRAYRDAWIARRIPAATEILLGQRNIFIFPTRSGFVFLGLLAVLLLTGINYQSNLVFALTFLLGGMFVVGVLHTYANLAQLRVAGGAVAAVFAGGSAAFPLRVNDAAGRVHDGLLVSWENGAIQPARVLPNGGQEMMLYLPARRRGWLHAPRLRLETRYPLGLLQAWTSLDLGQRGIVYPRPAVGGPAPLEHGGGEEGATLHDPGGEDFAGFRDYRPGDPLRHVAWKTLAKGQPLQTRDQHAFLDRSHWLRWRATEGYGDTEARLALLCRWVLELDAAGVDYGLELPGTRLDPAHGDVQRERALTALALFGSEEPAA